MRGDPRRAHRLLLAAHAVLLAPVLKRNCTLFGSVITRFRTHRPEIWLTIDDGPDAVDTPRILDLLGEYEAVASFFAVGQRVDAHRKLAERIHSAGHTLENHTFSHPVARFWSLGRGAMQREISRGTHAIRTAIGRSPRYFRAPVGMWNPHVHPILAREGLLPVGWSIAGGDGFRADPERVANRVLGSLRPGAIVMLHEGSGDGSGPSWRPSSLQFLLRGLRDRGFSCVLPECKWLRS